METTTKYLIAYDTLVDGWQTDRDVNGHPRRYDSRKAAVRALIENALDRLEDYDEDDLVDMEIDPLRVDMLREMLSDPNTDHRQLDDFFFYDEAWNIDGEFVVSEDEYIEGRKAILYIKE